jgi:hypothetical protein
LACEQVPDDSALIVCDDDIAYKSAFITTILQEWRANPSQLYTYCSPQIAGYKGFVVQKRLIKSILNHSRPDSCFFVDDDFIAHSARKLGLSVVPVLYKGDNRLHCSMDQHESATHPAWAYELQTRGNRKELETACKRDFIKLHKGQRRLGCVGRSKWLKDDFDTN